MIRFSIRAGVLALALCFMGMAYAGTPSPRLSPRAASTLRVNEGRADNVVSAYVMFDPNVVGEAYLKSFCLNFTVLAPGKATARLYVSRLEELARVEGVEYVQTSAPAHSNLDVARPEIKADDMRSGSATEIPYTGRGVVVGIVDAGFDYKHTAFRDSDGNLRISRVWEQSANPTLENPSPERFGYGMEMRTPEAILAAGGDIFNNSHGTHVINIAAGSDPCLDGRFMGIAPDAEIVLVSIGHSHSEDIEISNGLAYIFDYAESVGKPCVINLSLGMNSGPHDGTSFFDTLADALTGPGRIIIGSAGNSRGTSMHAERVFNSTSDEPLYTLIDFKGKATSEGRIEIWSDADCDVYLFVRNSNSGDIKTEVKIYPTDESMADIALGSNASGTINVSSEVSPLNGKHHMLLTNGLTGLRAYHNVGIKVVPRSAGRADIWVADATLALTNGNIEGYAPFGGESTIQEIGGTAKNIVTVGAYATRNEYVRFNETALQHTDEIIGTLASFSSSGPTADGRIKPEVTAPGSMIGSAISSNDGSSTRIVAYSHNEDGTHENMFGYMQGTSMAAPMVTGTVACWLQAWPEMTPADVLDVITRTARPYEGIATLPDNDTGYGKIDAVEGLKLCINHVGIDNIIADNAPFSAVVTVDGSCVMVEALNALTANVEAYNMAGNLVACRSGSYTTVNLSGNAHGVYLVRVTVDGQSRTFKVII